jgi:hypothetical protein
MEQIDQYADTLRALGRFLDQAGARGVEIGKQNNHWSVVWQGPGESTSLLPFQLHALRIVSRLNRGLEDDAPPFSLSQILRTLGQLLDTMKATTFIIHEVPGGFQLSASVSDKRGGRTYAIEEIRTLAQQQLAQRIA